MSNVGWNQYWLLGSVLYVAFCGPPRAAAEFSERIEQYNVVWDSPSENADGSMPLGNGEVALNAWIEPNGDLVFYIARTDSWDDLGRLVKVGRVRITLDPRPIAGAHFQQTLRLPDGTLEAVWGEAIGATRLQLWVDANHPVVHVTVDSPQPVAAAARIELWRTEPTPLPELETSDVLLNCQRSDQVLPPVVEPDTILESWEQGIGWYHHNVKSVGPALTAQIQGVSGFERPDPLLQRTFGAVITADGASPADNKTLRRPASFTHRFNVFVHTQHPATPEQWATAMKRLIATISEQSTVSRDDAHRQWWRRFWDRSWVEIRPNDLPRSVAAIPLNPHPVRIGVDQTGHNRFAGEIGRISIWDRALSVEEIAKLAATAREEPLPADLAPVVTGALPVGTELPELTVQAFSRGVTIEAWVNPAELPGSGGRIVDKVTPGGSDGMLLDTFPGNSLRWIAGSHQVGLSGCLPAAQWSHVVAVVDRRSSRMELYLNGNRVIGDEPLDGPDAEVVSQMMALQRFIAACAGRGAYPIKFNGSLFTVPYPGKAGDADYRRWGPGYWWQNTRLPYYGMCMSGDFEMMRPLFHMYAEQLMPLQKYRTRLYLQHDGAYIPECIYFWGDVFTETYGWTPFEQRADKLQESGWHKWEWVSGLELVWLMMDYYDHTQDNEFLTRMALPTAQEILTFFDQHYQVGADGKLVMHPSQALETWWECTNPMPELAGLHAVTQRLQALAPELTSEAQREFWSQLLSKLPPLPTHEIAGKEALAPAAEFARKSNIENPELYAVFPFRLVSFEKDNVDLGRVALAHRSDRGNSGWRQDDIFMAYLGLADEARDYVVNRARSHDARSRFPAFWGPNYDWVPDQDHGSVLLRAVQSMLMQTEGKRVYLLPSWPTDWDVHFKLHAPYRTVVEGEYRSGRLVRLDVAPESRRGDIVVCSPEE